MNKQDVISFFDQAAADWDDELICSEEIVEKILSAADLRPGDRVLDVACGTGVLIPFYLRHQVQSVTGIDISPEMAKIAARKFAGQPVTVLCGDVEETAFDRTFDDVMVYNAFPHFPDPEHLVQVLAGLVAPGGSLTVAHGMSRAEIDRRHHGHASAVSHRLMDEQELSRLFSRYLTVTTVISDETMYQVTGKRL